MNFWQKIAASIVLVSAAILLFAGLGAAPLQDYDEATYAQVVHESLHNPYFEPTFGGVHFIDKPPLYIYLADSSVLLFGESEFSLRFPSALLGLGTIILVMLIAFEISDSYWISILAGTILATTGPFIEIARQVRVDVPVTFFIVLALYGFLKGLYQGETLIFRWGYLLFGAAAGMAIMTKSVIAIFAFVAIVLFAINFKNYSWIKNQLFWWGMALCIIIAAPWHIYETVRFGEGFWRQYIGFNVLQRSQQDIFSVSNTNGGYIWYLATIAAPWSEIFFLSLLFFILRKVEGVRRNWAPTAIVLSILAVFFIAATKAPTYLVPVYPFMALAIVLAVLALVTKAQNKFEGGFTGATGAETEQNFSRNLCVLLKISFCAAVVLALILAGYISFHFNTYFKQADILAADEKIAGQMALGKPLYIFKVYDLGSIMYYSQNTKPYPLSDDAKPGSLIIFKTVQQAELYESFPRISTSILYAGPDLTVAEILSED